MIILRAISKDVVKTFVMPSVYAAEMAAHHLEHCAAGYFIAECATVDSKRGHIIKQRAEGRFSRYSYTSQWGRYKDTIYTYIGTKEECEKKAAEINAAATHFGAETAEVCNIAGNMYGCDITQPYLD